MPRVATRSRGTSTNSSFRVESFSCLAPCTTRITAECSPPSTGRRIYAAPELARSERPERLAKIRQGTVARSIRDAVARAKRAAGPDGLVVVAGSIFLLAETRALVKNVPTDPPIAM